MGAVAERQIGITVIVTLSDQKTNLIWSMRGNTCKVVTFGENLYLSGSYELLKISKS